MFEVLDRPYLAKVRRERGFGANPWRTHSRFLISRNLLIDPAYTDPMRERLGSMLPGSLLILDEAHHAAPASGGHYGIETKLTRAVRDLGGRFEHRLSSCPRRLTMVTRIASRRSSSCSIHIGSLAASRSGARRLSRT